MVGNGVPAPALGPAVRTVSLPENVGVPAGRNVGWAQTAGRRGDLPRRRRLVPRARPRRPPASGVRRRPVAWHRGVPGHRPGGREHPAPARAAAARRRPAALVARSRRSSAGRAPYARRVLEEVGGLPDAFFYAHEETDLAWRALDAGWRIRYDAGAHMHHPATSPARHASTSA